MTYPAWLSPNLIFTAAFLIGCLTGPAVAWVYRREIANKGKVWLNRLNSNNKTGLVERVKADREGYQIPGGPYVKFEGDHAYIDRGENRPLFTANEDTGLIIRAAINEAESLRQEEAVRKEPAYIELQKKYPATLMTAKVGESQEMDGSIYAAFSANKDIERLNLAGSGINWSMIAACGVILACVLLGVVLYVLKGLTPSGG